MRGYRTFLVAFCASTVAASAGAGNTDPFRESDGIHDTGLARLADEAGDASLGAALVPDAPRERALLAARAAPFAAAPEQLIPALAALACGRDPNLAPEAALALRLIGDHLRPSEMSAREVLQADLVRAREALESALGEAKALRPDIARDLGSAAAALSALSGPKQD
ncbi:MAG: hypothetical protein QM778_07590 [Myxococcales bacterium]